MKKNLHDLLVGVQDAGFSCLAGELYTCKDWQDLLTVIAELKKDQDRLNYLDNILNGSVCCRDSFTGRGFRLHETTVFEAEHFGVETFNNVRDAIDLYIDENERKQNARES